jgi:integrase
MPRNPEVNFYLKPIDKEGKSLIFLNFKYNKKRLFFSFGERIKPKDWNENKQRSKQTIITNDGEHTLNNLLENLKKICEESYLSEKAKGGFPPTEVLQKHLQNFLNQNATEENQGKPTLYKLIGRFIDGEIKFKGRNKSPGTIQTYKSTLKHLQEFEKKEKYKIDFDSITLDFYYLFVDYLSKVTKKGTKEKMHGINNIGKQVKNIKVFMNEAVELGYTTNLQFKNKKFITPSEEGEGVYLTDKEIENLYKFDFSENKKLERVKDLFVFSCFMGLRFSDFTGVKDENIVKIEGDLFVKLITKKTNESVIIPCHPIVLEIFEKYKENANRLPRALSNQKFNEYVKDVCREAKMNETGRLFKFPKKELWECIESRTARRSFATNLYLDGYEVHEIMKITTHKTEKAFKLYIKATKLDSAKRLQAHYKKRWAEKMYKASENLLSVA